MHQQILGLRSAYSELQWAMHHPGDAVCPPPLPLCIPRVQKTQKHHIYNFWNNSALEVIQNILPHSLSLFFFTTFLLESRAGSGSG